LKFVLFVEGRAELIALPAFVKRWLDPKLSRRIGIQPVKFNGSGDYVDQVARKAKKYLDSPGQRGIIAVIGLLDLYGLPDNFCPPHLLTAQELYSWAKQELEKRVRAAGFHQYFAVHELEAWLLSDPNLFPGEVRNALPGLATNPETVNFTLPPAKLLEKLYREKLKRHYRKTVDSRDLFGKLDPGIAYQKCPRFREMLDEMLKLAKDSGL
jgi:hypothetical protein